LGKLGRAVFDAVDISVERAVMQYPRGVHPLTQEGGHRNSQHHLPTGKSQPVCVCVCGGACVCVTFLRPV
jgi:hypothetical protein